MPPIVRIVPLFLLVYLKRLGVTASDGSAQEGCFMIVAHICRWTDASSRPPETDWMIAAAIMWASQSRAPTRAST